MGERYIEMNSEIMGDKCVNSKVIICMIIEFEYFHFNGYAFFYRIKKKIN